MKYKIIFIFLLSTSLQAALLIEPYAGYAGIRGKSEFDYEDGVSYNFWYLKSQTQLAGGRLGYQMPVIGLMLGIDYTYQPNHKIKAYREPNQTFTFLGEDTPSYVYYVRTNHVGLFAGVDLPILLRAWASYYYSNMRVTGSQSPMVLVDGDTFEGRGFGFGIGFKLIPFTSINFEYRRFKYGDHKPQGQDYNYHINKRTTEFMATLSIPLVL